MAFQSKLADQAIEFTIEQNESVLEAALQQNISLPYGCRNGACGACKAELVEGSVSYAGDLPSAISEKEHADGYALLCQAHPQSDLLIKSRMIDTTADLKLRKFPCRVRTCEKLNDDVMRLYLELPKTERLQFLAGQYIDILMQGGKRRSFSMANPPHQNQLIELHIRHYNGGLFSEYAFNELQERALLRIEGPLGQFTLNQSERPSIMIAGGTGFAPIKSLIEHTIKTEDTRSIYLYWGARSESGLYLHELARQWADKYQHINYIPVLSEQDKVKDWQGKTGFVHDAVLQDFGDLSGYDVYVCGPPPMINAVVESLPKQGLAKENLYSDSFEFAAS